MGAPHTHHHNHIEDIPNVGVLRYLKDPVSTLNELYARYPDGGEYGWFALCTDTNQFAVWNTATGKWKNSGLVPIEAYEESTQTPSANDYLLLYSVALQKAVKVKVSKIATGSSAVNVLKSEIHTIDTGDFFPPATNQFPFLITPGSYGVVFTDPPIVGLDETNFNLKVDYVSFDASGADGDQDILQTLTTKDGISYTRRLYHENGETQIAATDFMPTSSTIEDYEESTQTPSANDYLLLYSVALQKAVKVKVSKIATGSSAVNVLKSETYMIDTGDFFPPATSMFPFLMTPGSYGVVFTDPPIAGLNETNFNLKVDYVSHDGSGADGDQDILQTLTTKDGVSYTRRLYHVFHQGDMSATDFKTAGEISEVDTYVSSETYTKYTKVNNVFIEL